MQGCEFSHKYGPTWFCHKDPARKLDICMEESGEICTKKVVVPSRFTDEQIRLRANEAMLNSKGFVLFIVHKDGGLETIWDTEHLTAAERHGIEHYRKCAIE